VARRADRRGKDARYSLRFGSVALVLIAGTLVLVLFVLPERYVLRPGFRESGMSFPAASTPFAPYPVVPVAAVALPRPPGPPPVIPPGPAEVFWAEVVPLLEGGRLAEALQAFDRYLLDYPADADVRRERAITLLEAGRPAEAVEDLGRLLATRDDLQLRLLLARTLRDLGRIDEAGAEYEALFQARPDDVDITLEWAQAYAWAVRYADAEAVLRRGLARDPSSIPLRVELARIYFETGPGRLEEARALLAPIGDADLAAAGALVLRDAIVAALRLSPPLETPTPSPLERAVAAREADQFDVARALLEDALRETPGDVALWQAYADLLEYELGDFDGAYSALLEVERLTGRGADLQYRLAQLETWLGRTSDAERRLVALLDLLDTGGSEAAVARAGVHSLLGDLRRWEGDRLGAAARYRLALADDPANARARAGLDALEADVERQLVELEAPRLGGSVYSLADTDDFVRLDLGGEWVDVGGPWVVGGTVGNRWISGVALDGGAAYRQGAYAELEGARWWRWGTVRTGLDLGVQHPRGAWDLSLGGSLGHRGANGAVSEVRYEHGPAHPVALTLQSVLANVVQDHVTVSHARRLSESWSLAGVADAAWLRADPDSLAAGSRIETARLQGALSVGRALSATLTLGLATRALTLTAAAPATLLPGSSPRRLFWDPSLVLSAGPYLQLTRDLSRSWKLTGRLVPGLALVDERGAAGTDLIPHASAEAGVRREGARYWTALDLFYYQGQFDGYRTYGARLSLGARDFSALTRP
jgi:predicted Zn-dependent protease